MAKLAHRARWYRPDGTVDQHTTHHHKTYGLTCEQFEALLIRSGEACEICRKSNIKLEIDHSPRHGDVGVRGLLCRQCNLYLKEVDWGRRPTDVRIRVYRELARVWDNAAGIPDVLWEAARAKAVVSNETITDVVVRALEDYVGTTDAAGHSAASS